VTYAPTASLLKCDISYSCAAVDKISTSRGPYVVAQLIVINKQLKSEKGTTERHCYSAKQTENHMPSTE